MCLELIAIFLIFQRTFSFVADSDSNWPSGLWDPHAKPFTPYRDLVFPEGIEPSSLPWKGNVLTIRRWELILSFLIPEYTNKILCFQIFFKVEVEGFEPSYSCSQSKRDKPDSSTPRCVFSGERGIWTPGTFWVHQFSRLTQ